MFSRITSTVTLSAALLVLIVTGALMYIWPYDFLTSSLHLWASLLLLASFAFHFYNNWNTYKRHLSARWGKAALFLSLVGVVPVALALLAGFPPFASVVEFGEKLRASGKLRDGEFSVIDLRLREESPALTLFAKAGPSYTSEPIEFAFGITFSTTPQMVVWLEDLDGSYRETLYVTGKAGSSSYDEGSLFEPALVARPEALPYWGHKRGVTSADGSFTPPVGSSELDAMTAATPLSDHQVVIDAPAAGRYRLLLEINRSFDFNDYYSPSRFPDDPVYSGFGSSGQPSLIYAAEIELGQTGEYLLSLQGRGHHSGADGTLYSDLEGISTAREMLDFVVVKVGAEP